MDNRRIKITWEPVSVTDKDSLVQIIKHEFLALGHGSNQKI